MFEAFCFLAGVTVGLCIVLSREPVRVRYDHWSTRTRLVMVHTTCQNQRRVIVQWDGDAWDRAHEQLIGMLVDGRLKLAELHGAEECMEHLEGSQPQ